MAWSAGEPCRSRHGFRHGGNALGVGAIAGQFVRGADVYGRLADGLGLCRCSAGREGGAGNGGGDGRAEFLGVRPACLVIGQRVHDHRAQPGIAPRVTGRRNCPVGGEIYNVYFKPPAHDEVCDLHPEAKLNRRADDNAETIKARLATYEQETRPLLDYYERTGRLRRIDGTRDAEAIYADIERIVNREEP